MSLWQTAAGILSSTVQCKIWAVDVVDVVVVVQTCVSPPGPGEEQL